MKQDIKAESSHSTCNMEVECGITSRLLTLKGEYSESKFARKCNIPISTMRKYLSGSMPGLDKALQISEALGVNIQWLSTGKGPKWASESQEQGFSVQQAKHQPTGEPSDDFWWYQSADDQAAIDLLASTEKELELVGQFPITESELIKNQPLREARTKLRGLYENPSIDPKLKTKIDLMLRLYFEDPAAEKRVAERMVKMRVRLRRTSSIVEAVIKAIGWEPPLGVKETIKTAVYEGELSEETVFSLISMIHKTMVAKDS